MWPDRETQHTSVETLRHLCTDTDTGADLHSVWCDGNIQPKTINSSGQTVFVTSCRLTDKLLNWIMVFVFLPERFMNTNVLKLSSSAETFYSCWKQCEVSHHHMIAFTGSVSPPHHSVTLYLSLEVCCCRICRSLSSYSASFLLSSSLSCSDTPSISSKWLRWSSITFSLACRQKWLVCFRQNLSHYKYGKCNTVCSHE